MKYPKISVITAVRNGEKTLQKAIDSLRAQNYPNLEYIVLEDGSTDNTIDIIKKNQDLIHYFESKPDGRATEAYIRGIEIASGDLIQFLNADDYYEGNVLEKVGALYCSNPGIEVISCPVKIIDSNGVILSEATGNKLDLTLERLVKTCLTNARFFSINLFRQLGSLEIRDNNGQEIISADREFLFRLIAHKTQYSNVDNCYYVYLSHPGSKTIGNNLKNLVRTQSEHIKLALKYLNANKFPQFRDRLQLFLFLLKSIRRLVKSSIACKMRVLFDV
ncbi:glycosyltransferase [Rickettsiales endosymbiont of Stachyamoeba lipophora]|uniref:glycosyltransferase n=1 Tax=Rickettsiales endosymbiont of Stachyamoeba lipophora TaxID=2486578 RepID=UPI000F64C6F9|nr:glycosyltransferase [Rickettsiales endosymbiont of Stachyamoeba lipophora]AZL15720.1 glycosyltransferase [Rickettsiales endosymbiont of Stachyamoeba lipophora]